MYIPYIHTYVGSPRYQGKSESNITLRLFLLRLSFSCTSPWQVKCHSEHWYCVYVCVRITYYVYACVFMYMYACVCACTCMYSCMRVCVHMDGVCVCTCIHVCTVHMCVYVCVCVYAIEPTSWLSKNKFFVVILELQGINVRTATIIRTVNNYNMKTATR